MLQRFKRLAALALLAAGLSLMGGAPAWAHKFRLFATAAGDRIEGYAYFSGGVRPKGLDVQVHDSQGALVATVTTAEEGRFALTVPRRDDYRLSAETEGHRAEWTIAAHELGSTLPAAVAGQTPAPIMLPPTAVSIASDDAALRAVVEDAVASQLRPLREQLEAYEDTTRLHDILGGLGWIAGLAGLAAWWGSRRRQPPET